MILLFIKNTMSHSIHFQLLKNTLCAQPVATVGFYGRAGAAEQLPEKLAKWLPRLLDGHDERRPKLRPPGVFYSAFFFSRGEKFFLFWEGCS